MNWIRSNESGLGFSSLVHQIFSLGQQIQFLCTPLIVEDAFITCKISEEVLPANIRKLIYLKKFTKL